jgi:hypothetical protein
MAVSMKTTSVPRWSTSTSEVESVLADPDVALVLLVVDCEVDHELVDVLRRRSVASTRVVRTGDSVSSDPELAAALTESKVGWRFVAIGPEVSVGRIASQLMREGAIATEISILTTEQPDITDRRERDVFCAHCHAVSVTDSAVDGVVVCSGCDTDLTVYYHYSLRHGAYLGFRADSEDIE